MSGYRPQQETVTMTSALGIFYGDVEALSEEIREVCENMPESLQNGDRYQTLDATATELEDVTSRQEDLPGWAEELFGNEKVTVSVMMLGGKRKGRESRATRAGNAAAYADAVIATLREWADAQSEKMDADAENDVAGPEELLTQIDEAREFADQLEEYKDQVEGCEFPSMFG
jgi:hypothetical protein